MVHTATQWHNIRRHCHEREGVQCKVESSPGPSLLFSPSLLTFNTCFSLSVVLATCPWSRQPHLSIRNPRCRKREDCERLQLLLTLVCRSWVSNNRRCRWSVYGSIPLPTVVLTRIAAFIDPFFSSGVHLAMTSALSAAATICASLRRQCSEAEAALWHTRRVSTSYTRYAFLYMFDVSIFKLNWLFNSFQIVVLSAYKQMRAQSESVLCDVDEDNYDRAFALLRPGWSS